MIPAVVRIEFYVCIGALWFFFHEKTWKMFKILVQNNRLLLSELHFTCADEQWRKRKGNICFLLWASSGKFAFDVAKIVFFVCRIAFSGTKEKVENPIDFLIYDFELVFSKVHFTCAKDNFRRTFSRKIHNFETFFLKNAPRVTRNILGQT